MAYTTINKNTDHFNTVTYTGNGGTNAVTGVGFAPDFTWIKSRSHAANHYLYDAVRGVENKIACNTTAAEIDMGTSGLNTFGTDGFTVGNDTDENANSSTYVSWNWKANGAGSANTDGDTNSTVSVNTTAGFSIVSWTGTGSATTVGHGLGSAPELIMLKNRTGVYGWQMYFKDLGKNKYIAYNGTDAVATSTQSWNDTAPTNSVFSVDGDSNNKSGQNIIAYCFKEKTGYSKFGTYIGNGNDKGTMVYTGFKPTFITMKRTSPSGKNFYMYDNKRPTFFNPNKSIIVGSQNLVEYNNFGDIDFLANGFKIKTTNNSANNSGQTYVYIAFGQSIVGSNNVPAVTAF